MQMQLLITFGAPLAVTKHKQLSLKQGAGHNRRVDSVYVYVRACMRDGKQEEAEDYWPLRGPRVSSK